ncbi:Hsp20/alpha crystallin family protein [Streptomyces scabiei]|uniref:Hsp20/alpha crystallin family protein n=1 Tax=Streptomyces scabiei TaxID=1930 RepID=UPI001B339CDC|nr:MULTISPECIES: Hsp20/alpha crystallin family protein [Streptomyces]MBP5889642.1 Hsp20/alpha crystallin family protein [Streptomyces sp. LBUM 1481]MBP5919664.1 Hsp20/alpha crystallin family protein [Streptomyces sp. LBUM 1483]MDX2685565.1 Hsp20/alpha crystallin family protein [Streptomyces scabiei]MDX2750560.1 Hsp20/alpha crystallin family protein [Streptomyces scabiei]MDX2803842.1 Hsp20/alpha crystallin family protein [Streptomyces scabiei]
MTHPAQQGTAALPAALRELDDLRTQVDQLMHAAFADGGWPTSGSSGPWAPAADIEDAEDAYLVELGLPGMDKEQITVEVSDGELDVHGEVRQRDRTGAVRRQTRHIGRFDYRTTLPPNTETEHISAELDNGVLTVRIPKSEKVRARRVEITG